MKKVLKSMLFLLAAVALLWTPQVIKAETTEDGVYEYDPDYYQGTCTITGYKGELDKVVFPSKIEGLKVTAIKCGVNFPSKWMSVDFVGHSDERIYSPLDIGTMIVPEGVKELQFDLKWGNVSQLKLPKSLETIKVSFALNYGSPRVDELQLMEEVVISSKVKSIDFSGPVKKIIIENGRKEIPDRAFECCYATEEVILPSSVKKLGKGSFNGCEKLKKIDLKNIEEIGERAFARCESLEEVTFNTKKLSIGEGAFKDSGLKKAVIPKNTTYIGEGAFRNCDSLEELIIKSPHVKSFVHYGGEKLRTLILPPKLEEMGWYQGADSVLEQLIVPATTKKAEEIGWVGFAKGASLYILNPDAELGYELEGFERSVVIYGYKNSTAQDFAKKYGHKFVALTTAKNLKAVNSGKNTAKVTWGAVKGVKEYTIYRSTKKDSGYKKLGTTTKTNYIDKSVAKGKTYYYKVAIGYKDSTGVQLSGIMSSPVYVKVVK